MVKSKKRGKPLVFIIIICLLIILLLLICRFVLLKPYSRFLYGEEKDGFYKLDLSGLSFYGSGNAEIVIQVDCVGLTPYTFVKKFDFVKFKYVWISEDSELDAEVEYGVSEQPYSKSNNVRLLITLPKGRKDCKIISVYSGNYIL